MLKRLIALSSVALMLFSSFSASAQAPELKTLNGVQRLYYHGQPYIMLSGELHNSTATTAECLEPAMAGAKAMHLNSLIVTLEWDQLEPQEGKYDFTCCDNIISLSEKYDLPVVITWFGTWKNGVSSYIPSWMKENQKKYFRMENASGEATDYISSFCTVARDADAKAFAALMRHIKARDSKHMVLFMQVENETGLWSDPIDNCKAAQKAYSSAVPAELITFLKANEATLSTPMKDYWVNNGKKEKGSWKEVFGDNEYTPSFFMQWAYASYVEVVAKAGKAEYNIPMYMNTVAMPTGEAMFNPGLVQGAQKKDEEGGDKSAAAPAGNPFGGASPMFPSGAPIYRAIDMYHVFAPSIDFFSPDIYASAFKNISDAYTRVDNPLFVPETGRSAGPAYYALAQNNAIGFSAFAIEDAYFSKDYVGVYKTLENILPVISEYQGTGKMKGFLREMGEKETSFEIDGYTIKVSYIEGESASYGLVIKTGEKDFVISGVGALVTITKNDSKVVTRYDYIHEGHFDGDNFVTEIWLNGDQTSHGQELYLRGKTQYNPDYTPKEGELVPRTDVASSEANQLLVTGRQKEPSTYSVRVFTYTK